MHKTVKFFAAMFFVSIFLMGFSNVQKMETKDGILLIHNEKKGTWGDNPEVALRFVRTIGGIEVEDENLLLNSPHDIVLDSTGNIYILDSSGNNIKKLSPDGEFIATIGQQGQGPGDFSFPYSIDIDRAENLNILDSSNRRIQILSPEGEMKKLIKLDKFRQNDIRALDNGQFALGGRLDARWGFAPETDKKEELPKLIDLMDGEGKIDRSFGNMKDYGNRLVNWYANETTFDVDPEGNFYIAFVYQNLIEKYDPEGRLIWQADRVLAYDTKVLDKGFINRPEDGGIAVQSPQMNTVSRGISVDSRGSIWVLTMNRQMEPEEITQTISAGGASQTVQKGKIKSMDIYKLEIFDSEGVFLGEILLDHLAHGMRIQKDFLFISDAENAQYYQYQIVEK
jgi:sugar lactone lactonase YvrE